MFKERFFNLHRKNVPIGALRDRAEAYVQKELITSEMANRIIRIVEQERGTETYANDVGEEAEPQPGGVSAKLTPQQMKDELAKREVMMQVGGADGETDQWRLYKHITEKLTKNEPLRLMVQASAGTGKSFLLTTVYLWCLVHKKVTKAGAPTGICTLPLRPAAA